MVEALGHGRFLVSRSQLPGAGSRIAYAVTDTTQTWIFIDGRTYVVEDDDRDGSVRAHAVCYAMVLANTIGKQGGTARRIRVTATVTGDRSDAGLKVVSSDLKAVVEGLEGIDRAGISDLAKNAEKGCPISNAIRGNVAISVDASAS